MTAIPPTTKGSVERSVERYRRLLWLYPADFRGEFGDDLVQAYRDLVLYSADRRGLWWRAARDLIASASRERAAAMAPKSPRSWLAIAGVVVLALASLVVGGPGGVLLVPAAVLIGLPGLGLALLSRAWKVRRTTGASGSREALLGVACFVPVAVILPLLGQDAGWWILVAVGGAVIVAAAGGIIWAAVVLLRSPQPGRRRPWFRAALFAVPSIAVLTFIAGASIHSYLRTVGPAGDHSVENAAPESRALWAAAGTGDIEEVERITRTTCADPWVRYVADQHGNRENARGHAIVNGHDDIERHLDDYMDEWFERCGETD